MIEILKTASKAGFSLAALGTALIYFVHIEWIKIEIFSTLTSDQTYKALIFSITITFIAFLFLVFAQVQSRKSGSVTVTAKDHGTAINNTGNGNITITKEK
ncbi:hypothetical protein [Parendozoicomonas sp. Alg238-R29]|uniref:hypothetical protein n=1 Tax=Parendozoicomonas sp. Alg238-R29 TaxID=2993446 RepID=UPI00248E85DA|nr:hypothetical protein [Parendozoicomonas sp. Alg238-R29]